MFGIGFLLRIVQAALAIVIAAIAISGMWYLTLVSMRFIVDSVFETNTEFSAWLSDKIDNRRWFKRKKKEY